MIQRFGTDKVSYMFALVLSIWFIFIACIGLYNIVSYDPLVIKAINPKCIIDYFIRNKKEAWISLGGVVLSITGVFVHPPLFFRSKFFTWRGCRKLVDHVFFG